MAAHVPYDAVLIMVNTKRYGGGGIYNFFLTFTSDNQWKDYVFIHELGHAFAGLADEYFSIRLLLTLKRQNISLCMRAVIVLPDWPMNTTPPPLHIMNFIHGVLNQPNLILLHF